MPSPPLGRFGGVITRRAAFEPRFQFGNQCIARCIVAQHLDQLAQCLLWAFAGGVGGLVLRHRWQAKPQTNDYDSNEPEQAGEDKKRHGPADGLMECAPRLPALSLRLNPLPFETPLSIRLPATQDFCPAVNSGLFD